MAEQLDDDEVRSLLAALGDAPEVTYAPPNIYPMSAPAFQPASEADRGVQPDGPLGVYVHIPFCSYQCMFCFYAKELSPAASEVERYVHAVERELAWIASGTTLQQLYVGGGTPTSLSPALLDRVLHAVFQRMERGDHVHTVECSPESITAGHVDVVRRHGIERVSMGLQSGDPDIRRSVNRRHADVQVHAALDMLVDAGLVVNIDLIYGLPGQTEESFCADVEAVAARGIHSITAYNLRVNEMTPVAGMLAPEERLDGARLVRWRTVVRDVATACGFEQTRWHTFRRRDPGTAAGAATRFSDVTGHGNQFGAGLSARSRLRDVVYRNHAERHAYVRRIEAGLSPTEARRPLDDADRRLRFVTLTLGDGLPLVRDEYLRAFGTEFDEDFDEPTRRLVAAGVVADSGHQIELTERGKLVHDLATRAFYPATVRAWMDARRLDLSTTPPGSRGSLASRR